MEDLIILLFPLWYGDWVWSHKAKNRVSNKFDDIKSKERGAVSRWWILRSRQQKANFLMLAAFAQYNIRILGARGSERDCNALQRQQNKKLFHYICCEINSAKFHITAFFSPAAALARSLWPDALKFNFKSSLTTHENALAPHPKGVERRAAGVEFIKKHQHWGASQEAIIRHPRAAAFTVENWQNSLSSGRRIELKLNRCLMPICARDVFAGEMLRNYRPGAGRNATVEEHLRWRRIQLSLPSHNLNFPFVFRGKIFYYIGGCLGEFINTKECCFASSLQKTL